VKSGHPPDDTQVVADEIPQNTDTRRYWDLTRNIYRWRYFPDAANQGVSRVDL
jgi:hypothetical protein